MSLIITDTRPQAALVLADGEVFLGRGFGASGSVTAEVVFNTAMTGYQEIVTDPSYTGQIVTLTYPHIGNVGVNAQDEESGAVCAAGLIIRSESPVVSNFRSNRAFRITCVRQVLSVFAISIPVSSLVFCEPRVRKPARLWWPLTARLRLKKSKRPAEQQRSGAPWSVVTLRPK